MFAILYDNDHCVTHYAFITHKAVWHKMTTIRYLRGEALIFVEVNFVRGEAPIFVGDTVVEPRSHNLLQSFCMLSRRRISSIIVVADNPYTTPLCLSVL